MVPAPAAATTFRGPRARAGSELEGLLNVNAIVVDVGARALALESVWARVRAMGIVVAKRNPCGAQG